MFETILLPTDGSERAERAAPYAVELAERFDATLHPMYVVDTDALGPEQVDRIGAGQFAEMTELHERAAAAIDGIREYVARETTVPVMVIDADDDRRNRAEPEAEPA